MSKPLFPKVQHTAPLRRLAALLLVLLTLAMAFAAALSLSRLESLQTRAVLSQAEVAGEALRQALEAAVRFGKPLQAGTGLIGMDDRMHTVRQSLPELSSLCIADAEGTIIKSLPPQAQGNSLDVLLGEDWSRNATAVSHASVRQLILPVRSPSGEVAGRLVLGIPEAKFQERIRAGLHSALLHMLVCLVGAAALLGLTLPAAAKGTSGGTSGGAGEGAGTANKRIMVAGCAVTGAALVCYSLLTIIDFRSLHQQIVLEKAVALASVAERDIERLLDKGLSLDRMPGLDRRLAELIADDAEIHTMAVLDASGQTRFLANARNATQSSEDRLDDAALQVDIPLERADRTAGNAGAPGTAAGGQGRPETVGMVRVTLDSQTLAEATRDIVLDAATVGIIALLFLVETTLLALGGNGAASQSARLAGMSRPAYAAIRPVAFVFLFAMDASLSFIPLQMESLYQPVLGLAKDVVLGLPISAEMGCAGLTVLACGAWIDRIGWRRPCMLGLAGAALGSLFSALAQDPLTFIAARGVTGLGYGLGLMAAQGYVVAATRPDERGRGMAQLFAGVYAGSLCGGAAGAMLAERLGYAPVFFMAAGLLLTLAAVLPLLFKDLHRQIPASDSAATPPRSPEKPVAQNATHSSALSRFLRSRAVLALACCAILPGALGLIGYLNYLLPLALVRGGASQSDVGRVLMLYSVFLIYLAPPLAKIIDHSSRRHLWIAASGLLAALGLGAYAVLDGLAAAAAATALLGLSASLAFSAQSAFALDLPETRALGESAALGITSAVERLGQVLGPLCLGVAVATLGVGDGVAAVGLGVAVATVFFWLLTRTRRKAA